MIICENSKIQNYIIEPILNFEFLKILEDRGKGYR